MKNLFLIGLAALSLASCSKKVSDLPTASETGANTFGARVDGTIWGPKAPGIMPHADLLTASFAGTNSYVINARNLGGSPSESEMEIYLKDVVKPGVYQLNTNTRLRPNQTGSYAYYVERVFTPKHEYTTSAQYGGTVNITRIDVANHVIAGTFSFSAKDQESDHVASITEGRFDLSIQ